MLGPDASMRGRKAAEARWAATTPEQRSESARKAAAGRWAGHVAVPQAPARRTRACRYCGDVVPMSRRQIKCSKPACNLDHNAVRNGIRPAPDAPAQVNEGTTA